jgi:predicted dehydrogenase/nucleoside-diphosphate-sugar epimerase
MKNWFLHGTANNLINDLIIKLSETGYAFDYCRNSQRLFYLCLPLLAMLYSSPANLKQDKAINVFTMIDNQSFSCNLRLLVIGGGAIVTECHLPAMRQLAMSAISAVVDISAGNLALARQIDPHIELIQADFRSALKDPKITSRFAAVLITLPNSMHAEAIELAFEAGLHVLCEKPLANSEAECNAILQLAQQSQRKLAVAMVRRYVPAFTTLRAALERGVLGAVQSVDIEHGSKFAWPANSGFYFLRENGGLLVNMGVHYIDQLELILGRLHPVSYWDDADGGVESNCEAHFVSASGVKVRLRLSFTHELKNTVRWFGESGNIAYNVNQFDSIDWRPHGDAITARLHAVAPFASGPWLPTFESCFIEQLVDFAAAVAGAKDVAVSGAHALETSKVIDACYALKSSSTFPLKQTAGALRPTLARGRTYVTGATGFVGGKLVERLAALDFDEIVTPVRSYSSAANIGRFKVSFPRIDLTDVEQLKTSMAGSRYVFHLAYGSSDGDAQFTIESTRAVLEAAIAAQVETLVVVSTCSVFGAPDKKVDENSPYLPNLGDYGRSKAEAEQLALAAAAKAGKTRIVLICPTAVYGPGGPTFTELPAKMTLQGTFCWIASGLGNVNYVYVENLVDALLLAAQTPEAQGKRFIVSDGVCTWKEFLSPLLGDAGKTLPNYSLAELKNLAGLQSRPTNGDLFRAMTINNAQFMSLVSQHRVLGPVKNWLTRKLPALQRKVQASRTNTSINSFLAARPATPTPPLWLADLFGEIKTEYVAERARLELAWKPAVELREGQARSLQWLEHIHLHPDQKPHVKPTDA